MAGKKKKRNKLHDLDENSRSKFYSVGAKLRKANSQKRKKDDSNWERAFREGTDNYVGKKSRRIGKGGKTLDDWAEVAFSKANQMSLHEKIEAEADDDYELGVVVQISRGGGILRDKEGTEKDFELPPELVMLQKSGLAVGEKVGFIDREGDRSLIRRIFAREQILSRPDPHRKDLERVIAVNVDKIIVVSALNNPRLNTKLIDRFLISIRQTSAEPVICINKCDLADEHSDEDIAKLESYRKLGITIHFCSATEGTGIDELVSGLEGKTCVFLGTSGVGKSSLLNALDPSLELKTQENRETDGRGRHTTVMARMFSLPQNIYFIDTPGVREFDLIDVEKEQLQFFFPEFDEYRNCKFSNCLHKEEKGCSITEAVAEGLIFEHRYESYLSILATLDDDYDMKRVRKKANPR